MAVGFGFYFPTFFVLALIIGGIFLGFYLYRRHQRRQQEGGGEVAGNAQPTAVNADQGHGATNPNNNNNEMYNYNNDPSNHAYGHQQYPAQPHPQGGGQHHGDGGIYGNPHQQQQQQQQPHYPPPPAHHQGHPPAGYQHQGGGDVYTAQGYEQPSADNDNKV